MTDLAIVGHGPSMNGSQQGGLIDSHARVCRVNPGHTPGSDIDYGEKTDIVADSVKRVKNSMGVAEFWPVGVKVIAAATNGGIGTLAPWFDGFNGTVFYADKAQLSWTEFYRSMRDPQKTKFMTNGLSAITCALERGFNDIKLYGFDNLEVGEHLRDGVSADKLVREDKANHDWAAESRLVKDMAETYGATITFAGAH